MPTNHTVQPGRKNGKAKVGSNGSQGKGKSKADLLRKPALDERVDSDNPKLKRFGTYGKLRDYLTKARAEGKTYAEIGKALSLTGSRIAELCLYQLDVPAKAKKESE